MGGTGPHIAHRPCAQATMVANTPFLLFFFFFFFFSFLFLPPYLFSFELLPPPVLLHSPTSG